ncbi:MAG TPA: 50S ribosomal protein L22 [Firmicutes bacterium]|uniref:Large ribosomal subunit protein uL22 n=1 Tax=Candidatus Fermentithermobacillus carboniphilus TaxID=3085328 RepID=A0AAT9L9I0_9FIRM|nr:MAG: 50S ribosomal protein L22 [Candidatus Fermentithermobacillus carboniphilus]HHW18381.1 50S ribosomal protein L22 [Candidatus Fermentithermobacillaceae bacterium]
MEARACVRHVRISPTKVRIVADLVRGKPVKEALAILKFTPKRASIVVEKAIRSAAANAENNFDMDKDSLIVSEIHVGQGPTLKRYHPRQRGQAFPILKRTSHLTVVVKEREEG